MFGIKTINKFSRILGGIISLALLCTSITCYADKEEDIAANRAAAVESGEWEDWPKGPVVSAESAILMEAQTGTILYAKNMHKQQYPASITKVLTSLIAIERCDLDEMVTFSRDAVFSIDPGSNHVGIDVGEQITIEQCLNAILIRSANEVSFGVAEHISGESWREFADIMNERAKELGALHSNFVNPNGLPNEEHVTTAYDMAMIGRAFFANDILCKMTTTRRLHIPPSETQPHDIIENNKMELIKGGAYEYEYLVGCKTGFTVAARSTLISCAEKDGLKLICVVLKDEAPYQYEDTIALFDYGFSNFTKKNVAEYEADYNIGSGTLFYSDYDIFGNSKPILALNKEDFVVVPKDADFQTLESEISYETDSQTEAARITYTYNGVFVGSASIDWALDSRADYRFEAVNEGDDKEAASTDGDPAQNTVGEDKASFVFLDFRLIGAVLLGIAGVLAAGVVLLVVLRNYRVHRRRRRRRTGRNSMGMTVDLKKKRRKQIAQAKRRQRRGGRY